MRQALALALAITTGLGPAAASAYPLDAAEETGIIRLEAYRRAQLHGAGGGFLPSGALLQTRSVRLHLAGRDFEMPPPDPELGAGLQRLLGEEARHYGVTLLDISDPKRPRYAALNPNKTQQPGSVGKIVVALAWFQALADLYPRDVAARKRLLYHAQIVANEFIVRDEHDVPFWKPGDKRVTQRPIEIGDRANLWTYLDWMCSASSNAAASMLMYHLILLKHFGLDYPVPRERAEAFFEKTPKAELVGIFSEAIDGALRRNGLDPSALRQGSFFTRTGRARVPSRGSVATAGELMKYAVRMEQGKLVDRFSSLEIKRLLYLTDRRIRYASSPALDGSAVYYKSGSLYSCKPEPGFVCEKYHGNAKNYLNSVAVVETIDRKPPLRYIVVVLSNVLRKNSAVVHQNLAREIHELIGSFHPEHRGLRAIVP